MRNYKILKNSGKCFKCGDEIESTHRHDFVFCSCKNIFVDGGKEYFRRGGDGWFDETAEDTSEVEYEDDKGSNSPVA